MNSNIIARKSKINTHSLKAENFKFLVRAETINFRGEYEIVPVAMNVILDDNHGHTGKHYLIYVLDADEAKHKVVINQEELDSVVAQIKTELGGVPVELIGVVNE